MAGQEIRWTYEVRATENNKEYPEGKKFNIFARDGFKTPNEAFEDAQRNHLSHCIPPGNADKGYVLHLVPYAEKRIPGSKEQGWKIMQTNIGTPQRSMDFPNLYTEREAEAIISASSTGKYTKEIA